MRRARVRGRLPGDWGLVWILLAAALAVLPLVVKGVSCGHDLSFHLLNWMEVGQQWGQGTPRPMWCFHAAWGAGEPRFVFYPPASWVLGAGLGLVLGWFSLWGAVPVAYTFVVLGLCGWAMRQLLREFVSPAVATLGGCVYLANPYMLFTAIERCAYAELLAAASMPLLLLVLLRARVSAVRLAVVVGLLWLTNAPAAVVGSYSVLVIGLVRCGWAWRRDGLRAGAGLAGRVTAGYGLGLGLAGFWLVPAVVERGSVQVAMAVLPGMRPVDNFLFRGTGEAAHDAVLRTASWIAVGVLAVAVVCAAMLLVRGRRRMGLVVFSVLTVVVSLMLLPVSAVVWRFAPELLFLQFPWRFLAMEGAVAVALLMMVLPSRVSGGLALGAGLVFVVVASWGGYRVFGQACDPEDTVAAQRALFLGGGGAGEESGPTDEYTPKDADNDALKPGLPLAWLAEVEDGGAGLLSGVSGDLVSVSDGRQGDSRFAVRATAAPRFLVVRLRRFAGWHAVVDGREVPVDSARDDGLLAVPLAGGREHEVEVRYRWTWDAWVGVGLSVVTGLGLVLFRWGRGSLREERTLSR